MAGDGFLGRFWQKGGEHHANIQSPVLVPSIFLVEAKDDADVVKKVAEFYKGYYIHDFQDWIEPLVQPEDVT